MLCERPDVFRAVCGLGCACCRCFGCVCCRCLGCVCCRCLGCACSGCCSRQEVRGGQQVRGVLQGGIKLGKKDFKNFFVNRLVIVFEKRAGQRKGFFRSPASQLAFQVVCKLEEFCGHKGLGVHFRCILQRFQAVVQFFHLGDQGDIIISSCSFCPLLKAFFKGFFLGYGAGVEDASGFSLPSFPCVGYSCVFAGVLNAYGLIFALFAVHYV